MENVTSLTTVRSEQNLGQGETGMGKTVREAPATQTPSGVIVPQMALTGRGMGGSEGLHPG